VQLRVVKVKVSMHDMNHRAELMRNQA